MEIECCWYISRERQHCTLLVLNGAILQYGRFTTCRLPFLQFVDLQESLFRRCRTVERVFWAKESAVCSVDSIWLCGYCRSRKYGALLWIIELIFFADPQLPKFSDREYEVWTFTDSLSCTKTKLPEPCQKKLQASSTGVDDFLLFEVDTERDIYYFSRESAFFVLNSKFEVISAIIAALLIIF